MAASNLSLAAFWEYATARKPVVITGASLGIENWSLELLDKVCGSRKVYARVYVCCLLSPMCRLHLQRAAPLRAAGLAVLGQPRTVSRSRCSDLHA